MDAHQKRVHAAYLAECSAQAAYDWLHEHRRPENDAPGLLDDVPKVLEYLLTRRNDPLIDLGIAQFGKSIRAIKQVFERGNSGVRCAALSNPVVGPAGFMRTAWLDTETLSTLLRTGSNAELEALTTNPFLDSEAIEHLLEKKEEFSELSEIRYLRMLAWLGSNPRMAQSYDRGILDGWAEYHHGAVFTLAWELARTLEPNKMNAYVLYELLRRIEPPGLYENPNEVTARWKIEKETEDGKRSFAYSFSLRTLLADRIEANDDLLNSDDLALRESFYRRFSVREYKDWTKFIEKDGENAFDAILENDGLWRSEDTRRELGDLAWKVPDLHSSMMAPNSFNWTEEGKRKQHPEWFRDEDEEYSNEPDAVIRRLDKKIDKIATSMDVDFDGYGNEPTIMRTEGKIEELSDKIDSIESALDRLNDKEMDGLEGVDNRLDELRASLNEARSEAIAARSNPEPVKIGPILVWIAIAIIAVSIWL